MNIAIYFAGDPFSGGGFTHQAAVLNVIRDHDADAFFAFTVLCDSRRTYEACHASGSPVVLLRSGPIDKLTRLMGRNLYGPKLIRNHVPNRLERWLQRNSVDLLFFLGPSGIALDLSHHNYVLTVWDLCHLDYPEFPEVAFNREFQRREHYYTQAVPRATAIIVDSQYGKRRLVDKYRADADRIHVLPFLPASWVQHFREDPVLANRIRAKYGIVAPYIFYPAQFWPHKNHIYILRSLRLLHDRSGHTIQVVFSGSDKGNLPHVLHTAKQLGLESSINYIGFVGEDELPYLYRGAIALVMPDIFGPTNIPPLEALALGCPVCYSDLPYFREQLGESAFFMDLQNPESLVNQLCAIQTYPEIVREKKEMGRKLLASWNAASYWEGLKRIFLQYDMTRRCWE